MMSKNIVFIGKLLYPKQIRTYQCIILRIQQIYLFGIESCLLIGKYKIFILLHTKQKLPSFTSSIILIYNRLTKVCPCHRIKERNHYFIKFILRITFFIKYYLSHLVQDRLFIDSHMMIVTSIHKIHWDFSSFFAQNQVTIFIFLFMQRLSIANASNTHAFNRYSFSFIQPYWIFIQVDECLFGISTILF